MTKEIAEHLRKMTSRNGRYWLRDSRHVNDAQNAEELPFKSVASNKRPHFAGKATMHESVVVSIPDVAVQAAQAASTAQQTVSSSVAIPAPQQKADFVAPTATPTSAAQVNIPVAPAPKPQPSREVPPATRVKISVPPLAPVAPQTQAPGMPTGFVSADDLAGPEARELGSTPLPFGTTREAAQPTAKPVSPKVTSNEDDAVKAARATQTEETESSIGKVADEILASFPIAAPSVIMFAGSQTSFHTDETCARVAAELAGRSLGRVLLIDSDFEERRLTNASGMSKQGGLSEVMNIAYPWQDAILKSGSSKLDFMPAGSCPHKRWTPKKTLREALAEIRNEYQFVCICVGDAHSSAASTWSELSDGALLVVSAAQSSDAIAQSAVKELRRDGARMLGCIVADIDA